MYYLNPDNKPPALGCWTNAFHYPARLDNQNPSEFFRFSLLNILQAGPDAVPFLPQYPNRRSLPAHRPGNDRIFSTLKSGMWSGRGMNAMSATAISPLSLVAVIFTSYVSTGIWRVLSSGSVATLREA